VEHFRLGALFAKLPSLSAGDGSDICCALAASPAARDWRDDGCFHATLNDKLLVAILLSKKRDRQQHNSVYYRSVYQLESVPRKVERLTECETSCAYA
jgi:hypothetical protein